MMSKLYKFAFEFLGLYLLFQSYLLFSLSVVLIFIASFLLILPEKSPFTSLVLQIPVWILQAILYWWLAKGVLQRKKGRAIVASLVMIGFPIYSIRQVNIERMGNAMANAMKFSNFIMLLFFIAIGGLITVNSLRNKSNK